MSSHVGNKRARQRQRIRLAAKVESAFDKTFGEITDISEFGLRIKLNKSMFVKPGEKVDVEAQHMGHLTGRVTWHRFKVMGIALDTSTNTYAQTLSAIREAHKASNAGAQK